MKKQNIIITQKKNYYNEIKSIRQKENCILQNFNDLIKNYEIGREK